MNLLITFKLKEFFISSCIFYNCKSISSSSAAPSSGAAITVNIANSKGFLSNLMLMLLLLSEDW
jgi:hypothetical protein